MEGVNFPLWTTCCPERSLPSEVNVDISDVLEKLAGCQWSKVFIVFRKVGAINYANIIFTIK